MRRRWIKNFGIGMFGFEQGYAAGKIARGILVGRLLLSTKVVGKFEWEK